MKKNSGSEMCLLYFVRVQISCHVWMWIVILLCFSIILIFMEYFIDFFVWNYSSNVVEC